MLLRRRNKFGFTLVELMVVVGLMGMLLLIVLPAFQGADRAGRVRAALFQLNASINLARQTAITRRQNIYILFPDSDLSYTQATIPYAYGSYALYGERDGYLGDWKMLPQGVVFDARLNYKNRNPPFNLFLQTDAGYFLDFPFPDANGSIEKIPALTYRGDGTLGVAGINKIAVYMSEGVVNYSDSFGNIQVMNRPGATTFGIEIRPESGQTRTREYAGTTP